MIVKPNLLPVPIIHARSRRKRMLRWSTALTCEAAVLTAVCLYANASSESEVSIPKEAISATVSQIDLLNGELDEARASLETIRQRIAIANTVTQRPEWSVVVALVAEHGAGLVTVESMQLAAGGGRESGEVVYRLVFVGIAESQTDLTSFVQRLKGVGLFDKVQVSETRQARSAESSTRVRFTVESTLVEEGQK